MKFKDHCGLTCDDVAMTGLLIQLCPYDTVIKEVSISYGEKSEQRIKLNDGEIHSLVNDKEDTASFEIKVETS